MTPLNCQLISDFNISNLGTFLRQHGKGPEIEALPGRFGQVWPTLLNMRENAYIGNTDVAVVWTRPEAVIESFSSVLQSRPFMIEQILAEVDRYADAILAVRDCVRFVMVPSWVVPTVHRGLGLTDLKGQGVSSVLARMNLRLAEKLDPYANCFVLNTGKWIERCGAAAFDPKSWYMGKIPFHRNVFRLAAADIAAGLAALVGRSRKLVVLDLDDTLWGGIVGETGWEKLRLGGHDPIGEAFVDFQRSLKVLRNRGVLLAIASKNDEQVALEAIGRHPEMVLALEDFVGWRINWHDKAANICSLVDELNLGLDAVVFIDDSPAERARVREACPEILVPEWPADKMLYVQSLHELRCFDTARVSHEDLRRTEMYAAERERTTLRQTVTSLEQWRREMELTVTVESLHDANLTRVVQLFNKTNQMNLTTRRLSEQELQAWLAHGDRSLWAFSVRDKYGDSGLTGVATLDIEGSRATIADFILSCRVFQRGVENAMLHVLVTQARERGAEAVFAQYLPTPRNHVCLEFWRASSFEYVEAGSTFRWDASRSYDAPDYIDLLDLAVSAAANA